MARTRVTAARTSSAMIESKEYDNEQLSDDPEFIKKRKKSRKKKREGRLKNKDDKDTSSEDDSSDEDDDDEEGDDDRTASFFSRSRKRDKKSSDKDEEQDGSNRLLGKLEPGNIEDKKDEPKGLTEVEAKDAVSAIADGLSRELRNEFDHAVESTVAELEAVAVASFVDSLRDKVESDEDITEQLLDEALREALEDLLGVNEDGAEIVDLGEAEVTDGGDADGGSNTGGSDSGGSGSNTGSGGRSHSSAYAASPVSAVVAANADVGDALTDDESRRGKGLLIGGVVGYIVGQRHGRKRAEAKLQPEIEQLEDQIAELYDALASRELMIRQVVQELASRQLGDQYTAALAALNTDAVIRSNQANRDASKAVKPPSLVIPAVFATLLVSKRLMADVSSERNTWGKDALVGGVAGYMIGRRHGRKKTETRIKSKMEQLEDQVYSLQGDLITSDSVMDAVMRTTAEADRKASQQVDGTTPEATSFWNTMPASVSDITIDDGALASPQHSKLEKQLVDASMDRIAFSRKSREIQRHKKHLLESGKAAAVGGFNMLSSVQMERRLMDGTQNSSERKQIEVMNEEELLVMSQNIYVDGESAVDLYDRGRVKIDVLRESVIQFWRSTGNYEQTLRVNLEKDESAINDIRTSLEKAYISILGNV